MTRAGRDCCYQSLKITEVDDDKVEETEEMTVSLATAWFAEMNLDAAVEAVYQKWTTFSR